MAAYAAKHVTFRAVLMNIKLFPVTYVRYLCSNHLKIHSSLKDV